MIAYDEFCGCGEYSCRECFGGNDPRPGNAWFDENSRRPEGTTAGDGTPGRALTTALQDNTAHDPSTCPCNDYGMGLPACTDCRSVFAAKREQLLASLRASEAQGWPDVPAWRLGVDPIYDDENDQPENIT